jgi:hypothetical protein
MRRRLFSFFSTPLVKGIADEFRSDDLHKFYDENLQKLPTPEEIAEKQRSTREMTDLYKLVSVGMNRFGGNRYTKFQSAKSQLSKERESRFKPKP